MQDGWQRRHAVQIVAALPESTEDALLVLALAQELVLTFLDGRPPQRPDLPLERVGGNVVSLSSANSGNSL